MANNYRQGTTLPTTYVYEASDIDVTSDTFKELMVRIQNDTNRIILALNRKSDGSHLKTVFNTGGLFFAPSSKDNINDNMRPIFRVSVDFGALLNNNVKQVPHGIPADVLAANLWALIGWQISATEPNGRSVPVPGFDPSDITKPISAWFDKDNVYIRTTSNMTSYTRCYVTFEFILS